jgi:hypothetical protein
MKQKIGESSKEPSPRDSSMPCGAAEHSHLWRNTAMLDSHKDLIMKNRQPESDEQFIAQLELPYDLLQSTAFE